MIGMRFNYSRSRYESKNKTQPSKQRTGLEIYAKTKKKLICARQSEREARKRGSDCARETMLENEFFSQERILLSSKGKKKRPKKTTQTASIPNRNRVLNVMSYLRINLTSLRSAEEQLQNIQTTSTPRSIGDAR